MKKLFLIILFIICLPVIINAKSYTSEASKTNNYMNKSNYSNTYKRYLLFSDGHNLKLGFSGGKVVKDNVFDTVTGFISSEEYKLTLPSTGTSYLYDGTSYWTLTGSDEKQTVFFSEPIIDNGLKKLEKNTTNPNIDSRATVYVAPGTNVTGTGKQTDPWIFVPRFEVTVKVSDAKHAKIREKETDDWKSEINGIYLVARKKSGSGEAKVTVSLDSGYMLMSNDCNGKVTDTDNINQKIFTVSNISRDTKCNLAVGTGRFIVKLGDKNYDNTDINPIYLRHSDNYYSNENYTDIIRKIRIPTRIGYTFDRYEYNSKEIIDKDGNLKDKVSITSTNAKDDNNKDIVLLTSAWHPNEYEVSFDPNGGMIDGSTNPVTRKYLYDRQYKERYASFPFVTRAGYGFIGWYTKATGGAKVTESDILTTAGNIVLYAHWDICKAGTYNNGSYLSCQACDKGTYQNQEGQTSCKNCVAGSYQDERGQNTCKACEGGKTSNAGAIAVCTENCRNTTGVASWKKTTWEPNNTVTNWCEAATCKDKFQIEGKNCRLIQKEWTFEYTGNVQSLPILQSGYYELELYAAAGGVGSRNGRGIAGGKGGSVKGITRLEEGSTIYVYVGGAGGDAKGSSNTGGAGGWNGGGKGGDNSNPWDDDRYGGPNCYDAAGGGGGATDVRYNGTAYSNRIIVAGGGGGGTFSYVGGAGGDSSHTNKVAGIGTTGCNYEGGSGGGGGGYLGGKTDCWEDGHGYGGSSYANSSFSNISYSSGVRSGNGVAYLRWHGDNP